MADRFADLLAKGRSGQLSEPEMEELARLLNAPILDPTQPSSMFVSKHAGGRLAGGC